MDAEFRREPEDVVTRLHSLDSLAPKFLTVLLAFFPLHFALPFVQSVHYATVSLQGFSPGTETALTLAVHSSAIPAEVWQLRYLAWPLPRRPPPQGHSPTHCESSVRLRVRVPSHPWPAPKLLQNTVSKTHNSLNVNGEGGGKCASIATPGLDLRLGGY